MKKGSFLLIIFFLCLQISYAEALTQKDIFKIRLQVENDRDLIFLEEIGLDCSEVGECECEANTAQLMRLRKYGLSYLPIKQGIVIQPSSLDSIYGYNGTNYYIHDMDTAYSIISITGAPAGTKVEEVEVIYDIIHTYVADLVVDLTDQEQFWVYNLWFHEGGGDDEIHDTVSNIQWFDGEPVNQSWILRVQDLDPIDTGYIDYWKIKLWYKGPSDLVVQSLTCSNYDPTVGEVIDISVTIKNYGPNEASYFWTDVFLNQSYPPMPPANGDLWWRTYSLQSGESYN